MSEVDPFPLTANAKMYVPRPAMDQALEQLLKLLRGGELCVRLVGPAGIGKTLLLRRVAQELDRSWRCVYLPYPKLGPEELWEWAAAELGARGAPEEAVARVAAKAYDREGALLLMVDDAHLQPAETRRRLAKACAHQVGLRFLLCETLDLTADAGDGAPGEVWLTQVPSAAEARLYLRERLRMSGASAEACALFDDATIDQLHQQASGSVATLHTLATALLRSQPSADEDSMQPSGDPAQNPTTEPALEPPAAVAPMDVVVAQPERSEAASPPPDRPKRVLTDREAISEIAANLQFTFRRPAPAPPTSSPAPAPPAAKRKESPGPELRTPGTSSAAAAAAVSRLRSLAKPLRLEMLQGERARWVALGLLGGLLMGISGALLAASWLSPDDATPQVVVAPPVEVLERPDVAAAPPRPPPVVVKPTIEDPAPSLAEALAPPPVPPPVLGRLNVNAIPWASIEIDGEIVGETPLGELLLPRGSRRIVARFPDGQETTRIIELAADEIFLVLRPDDG